jgi:hypothetical protein
MEYENCVEYEAYWTDTVPVHFDGSKEELEMEFEIAVEEAIKKLKIGESYDFNFNNLIDLDTNLFCYYSNKKPCYSAPRFFTFEEWCLYYNSEYDKQ